MASKSKDVRPVSTLACTDCKERNYTTQKNRRNDPNRIEFKKFCPRCRKHTLHRETKEQADDRPWTTDDICSLPSVVRRPKHRPVAQLGRAPLSKSGCCGFKSCLACLK